MLTERRDRNTVQLATLLDEPETLQRLVAALKLVVKNGERVGLPAILGLHEHHTVMATLARELAAPIFEIPTLPPSVPGIRLTNALRRHLATQGVRVEVGMEVIGSHLEEGRVAWVETATSARPLKHRATTFLLATGGVLGGGFTSDHNGRFWETIFHLPLTVPEDRSQWFRPRFLDPAGQPAFRRGCTGGQSVPAPHSRRRVPWKTYGWQVAHWPMPTRFRNGRSRALRWPPAMRPRPGSPLNRKS